MIIFSFYLNFEGEPTYNGSWIQNHFSFSLKRKEVAYFEDQPYCEFATAISSQRFL